MNPQEIEPKHLSLILCIPDLDDTRVASNKKTAGRLCPVKYSHSVTSLQKKKNAVGLLTAVCNPKKEVTARSEGDGSFSFAMSPLVEVDAITVDDGSSYYA